MSRRLTCLTLLLLGGCGFHLQGPVTPPAQMERTYVAAAERNSLFHRKLRRSLLDAGVELVDSPAEATAVLTIRVDETDQRVLSVSARNVPTEYEVYYIVEYSLQSGEEILIELQDLTLTRTYTYDTTLVLGKAREEQLLREAIVDDLVRLVVKQLSTL